MLLLKGRENCPRNLSIKNWSYISSWRLISRKLARQQTRQFTRTLFLFCLCFMFLKSILIHEAKLKEKSLWTIKWFFFKYQKIKKKKKISFGNLLKDKAIQNNFSIIIGRRKPQPSSTQMAQKDVTLASEKSSSNSIYYIYLSAIWEICY